ncbi:excisionase [Thiothrix winogradskyi]|uniref:Excisionase-like domain-containing protein n=1 Tax=Thiothrix winogradskyi TaxID=96472 RepID=A0ABY3T1Z6_9GAMM|nr:excisionase [Thiothrix winogradskyi]UJS24806.1 hypothetical protein L2Y54_01855 [Thiothrix winogradskyi]
MKKLLTLEAWAALRYSEQVPSINTLRLWAREGRIQPQPVKHGRTYRVLENAKYYCPFTGESA